MQRATGILYGIRTYTSPFVTDNTDTHDEFEVSVSNTSNYRVTNHAMNWFSTTPDQPTVNT